MRSFVLSSLVLLCAGSALAGSFKNTVNGAWSTGLDNAAVALAGNTADSHYFLIQPSGCGVVPTPANCAGFGLNPVTVIGPPDTPGNIWTINDANSKWVGPIGDQRSVQSNTLFNSTTDFYVYRLLIDFTSLGLHANTASVELRWLSDNSVNSVSTPTQQSHIRVCAAANAGSPVCDAASRVTGSNSGIENTVNFANQTPVTIDSSYFTSQLMAMDFVVYNSPIAFGANPTGLRVEILSATADPVPDPVPEPATLSMMALALTGLGLFARRK